MPSTTPRNANGIAAWTREDRPRERLLRLGAQNLSSSELLAICFGSGRGGEDALAMSRRLLIEFGGLDGLLGASTERLLSCVGLGSARVALLKALQELRIHHSETTLQRATACNDVTSVSRFLQRRMGHHEREVFACLFLDSRHCLIRFEELFFGSVNRAHVHSREVLKRGIELNAAAVILAHNHPSGVAEPSSADLHLTRELIDLLARVDIIVLDHVIIARSGSVSMANRGIIGN